MKSNTIKEKDYFNYFDLSDSEILKNEYLKIILVDNNIDIYNDIARLMANKLKENNEKGLTTSFILPVGPRGQYKRFVHICNTENISCKRLITINMDEYLDERNNLISKKHPLSFRGFMERNLFNRLENKLKIKSSNIFFPDPKDTTLIEKVIKDVGEIDICFGGIGINGHIAFNEPIFDDSMNNDKFFNLKTRILDISKETIITTSLNYGGNIDLIPKKCITIGIREIFASKELRFYLEHDWKYSVLIRSIYESPNPTFPASFIKMHKNSSITISQNVLINSNYRNRE